MMNDESEQPKRSSIADLERLLNHDDEVEIEILPNGEVRSKPSGENSGPKKPLTFRDNLGTDLLDSPEKPLK